MSQKTKTPANLQPHPLASILPMMNDNDYQTLLNGMKQNGYDDSHPVILYEEKILDGVHRYTAARKLKLKPAFKEFKGDDPVAFVVQENLARRNLTPSQASAVAADLVEAMEAAEKAEKEAAVKDGKKPKKPKGEKAVIAAKSLGVSARSVHSARKVKKSDKKLHNAVKQGGTSLHKASQEVDSKKSAEAARTEEFAKAQDRIDKICGEGFALKAAKTLTSSDILKLSGLDAAEIKRVKPFLESGWKLKAALGYKSATLSAAHTIRQLLERTIEQQGTYSLEIPAYGRKFTINSKMGEFIK